MSVAVTGIDKTRKLLMDTARELSTNGVRKSVRAAGKVFKIAIQEAAPELSAELSNSTALPPGTLKADVKLQVVTDQDGTVTAIVGPGKGIPPRRPLG